MTSSMISPSRPLILASASPRRKRLLEQIGLPFRSVPSRVEEEGRVSGDPAARAGFLAEDKAGEVGLRVKDHWILGADTVVVLGETVLGKPVDRADAENMLIRLRGNEHRVITGFCLLDPSGCIAHRESVETLVRMKSATLEEVRAYIATGEPFGKAGGYAIQGIGAFMIEAISGSYANVVGLPLCALVKALLAAGALKGFPMPA